ncbi:MAG TPA: alanine--tRNA ligase-related protein [Candidatus Paceibacterota bacterium]
MTVGEVRKRYLDFMKVRGHFIVPSANLVPEGDQTTLFTGSGMQPMIPYLLGEKHPQGTRIADSQKSFRTEDIEEVGDNRHTTFFEMLGNWSFGDYFRKEQIAWMAEFLFNEIKINPEKFYVTVFAGDEKNKLPKDAESAELWQKIYKTKGIDAKVVEIGSEEDGAKKGMQGGRIFYYNAKKNWWSRAGVPDKMPVGEPGGPDTEMFYEFSEIAHDTKYGRLCHPNCDCGRYMEIGNNVFMTYKKTGEGKFSLLPRKNVDFGGGLERITAAANNDPDVFKLDVFASFVRRLEKLSRKEYLNPEYIKSFRIVADHTRAAIMLIADGVRPANSEQGYVLRRLIRRSVRHVDKLGIGAGSLYGQSGEAFAMYREVFGYSEKLWTDIAHTLAEEEAKFRDTLKRGLHKFEKGERDAFVLFTTYGFPFELSAELAAELGEKLNESEFKKKMSEHQALSRSGSEGKFKGGLADTSDMSVKYHTATHLLQQALREVLGKHVFQKGSNITPERLRFDFSHPSKMTDEEKKKVEDLVNKQIKRALAVSYEDLPIEEAEKRGALGLFEEKYGDKVRVYKIGDFSLEFCGGPHVAGTNELGAGGKSFKILKEEAVSSGIRRIKAVLQ